MIDIHTPRLVYKNAENSAKLYQNLNNEYFIAHVDGVIKKQSVQKAFTLLLAEIRETGSNKVIFDFQKMKVSDQETLQWLVSEILPEAIGSIAVPPTAALIPPQNISQRLILEKTFQEIGHQYPKATIRFPESLGNAIDQI